MTERKPVDLMSGPVTEDDHGLLESTRNVGRVILNKGGSMSRKYSYKKERQHSGKHSIHYFKYKISSANTTTVQNTRHHAQNTVSVPIKINQIIRA
jgi:hypothetical protein